MALPGTADLEIYHGDTWSQSFRLLEGGEPLPLSGSSVYASAVGLSGNERGSVVNFVVTIEPEPGMITLSLGAAEISVGQWSYDVQVNDPEGVVTTWLRGMITVIPDVT